MRSQQQHMMLFSFHVWQHQQLSSCPQEAPAYPLPPLLLPQSRLAPTPPLTSATYGHLPLTYQNGKRDCKLAPVLLLQSNDPPPKSSIICFPEEGGQQRCSCRGLTSVNRLRGNLFGSLETPHGKLKWGPCKNWPEDGGD